MMVHASCRMFGVLLIPTTVSLGFFPQTAEEFPVLMRALGCALKFPVVKCFFSMGLWWVSVSQPGLFGTPRKVPTAAQALPADMDKSSVRPAIDFPRLTKPFSSGRYFLQSQKNFLQPQ